MREAGAAGKRGAVRGAGEVSSCLGDGLCEACESLRVHEVEAWELGERVKEKRAEARRTQRKRCADDERCGLERGFMAQWVVKAGK